MEDFLEKQLANFKQIMQEQHDENQGSQIDSKSIEKASFIENKTECMRAEKNMEESKTLPKNAAQNESDR